MGTRTCIVFMLVVSLAACSSREVQDPEATDAALSEGAALPLPIADPFPRIGLQWTYDASIEGFPSDCSCPPRVAYRLTAREEAGHPWAGWWIKGKGWPMEFVGSTISKDHVFFHPPRLFPFQGDVSLTYLQLAPWPVAHPGKPGKTTSLLVMDPSWQAITGEKDVQKEYVDVGSRPVEVPAGRFESAWYVEGSSPGWTGRFWWVDRVGWARMTFTADDGRTVDLKLAGVRSVAPESGAR